MRDKVTRQCPQTTTFEEKGEPKRIQTKAPLLTSLTPYHWAKPALSLIIKEKPFKQVCTPSSIATGAVPILCHSSNATSTGDISHSVTVSPAVSLRLTHSTQSLWRVQWPRQTSPLTWDQRPNPATTKQDCWNYRNDNLSSPADREHAQYFYIWNYRNDSLSSPYFYMLYNTLRLSQFRNFNPVPHLSSSFTLSQQIV